MSYAKGYQITYRPRTILDRSTILPAHINDTVRDRRYTFMGGYGDEDRKPTQEGCRLIANWLDAQGVVTTQLPLTAALDAAKAWAGTED